MSPVTFYIYASNSLIIHKANTKEINVQWVFGNQMKNCLFFNPLFLLLKSFCLRSNIKHFPVYNLTRSPWTIWTLRSTISERLEQATDETDLEVRQNTPLSPRRFFNPLRSVLSDETLTYITKNTINENFHRDLRSRMCKILGTTTTGLN